MSRFSKTVLVVANPWFAIDHKGRPCGAVPVEPKDFGTHLGFVGAKVDKKRSTSSTKPVGHVVPTAEDTVFEFSTRPVKVARTPYYRQLLKQGNLFPADKTAADWAGVKFVEPEAAIAAAKAEAEKSFDVEYGQGALEELRQSVTAPPAEEKATEPAAEEPAESPAESESESPDESKSDSSSRRRRNRQSTQENS